jgi:tetratricopeptide (TPR) repeat protein
LPNGDIFIEAQGDFIGAEGFYMQARQISPEDAGYLIFAGSVAFQSGNIERAIQLARQATRSAEGCIDEAWFNLGGYLLSANNVSRICRML